MNGPRKASGDETVSAQSGSDTMIADPDAAVRTIFGLPAPGAPRPILPTKTSRRSGQLCGTQLLGRYQVDELIGQGGMASVYRGHHLAIGNSVAIKVLDSALLVPDAVDRFLREAQATSRIKHENVVAVTDFGSTDDGVVFTVMELLSGETLYRTLEEEPSLPPERAAKIMLQICGALEAAHQLGIVHRDLKPENCFRCPRTNNADFIKVLDFGIAKVQHALEQQITAAPRKTRVGIVVGTPEFMAPEQARAEDCDHRADIYAAGVMLFLMLGGELPYRASSAAETLAMHLHAPVPSLRDRNAALPPALCAVAERALNKDPADRFQSMSEMAKAIDDALRVPIAPPPAPVRKPFPLAVAAGLFGVAALGVAVWIGMAPTNHASLPVAADQAQAPPPRAEPSEQTPNEPEPEKVPRPVDPVAEALPTPPPALASGPADAVAPPQTPSPSEANKAVAEETERDRPRKTTPKRARVTAKQPAPDDRPAAVDPKPGAPQPAIANSKISEVKNPFAD